MSAQYVSPAKSVQLEDGRWQHTKQCRKCGETKPLDSFHRHNRSPDGHQHSCSACRKPTNWERPDFFEKRWRDGLKRCARCGEFKSPTEYTTMPTSRDGFYPRCRDCQYAGRVKSVYGADIEAMGDSCEVCGARRSSRAAKRLSVDHCHTTGRVRGLLCQNCNMGIGRFMDDPALLRRAADYLERGADGGYVCIASEITAA